MSIKPDQVVTIQYTVKDEDGKVVDATGEDNSYSFLSGQNQILPKLEETISDMLIGSTKTIELSPEEAYGDYQEDAVQQVNRSDFPEGTQLEVGMSFVANMADGKQLPFVITAVDGDDITIDFNHPLAGKKLTFEVKLIDVRDATPEELAHGHVHGPGGHAH